MASYTLIAPTRSSAVVIAEGLVWCGETDVVVTSQVPDPSWSHPVAELVCGETRYTSTAAAILHLAQKHPDIPLFSGDGLELIGWEIELSLILRQIAAAKTLTQGDPTGIFYAGLAAFDSVAAKLETHLSHAKYIGSDAWSLLDSYVVWFFNAVSSACPLSRRFPNLERLADEAADRPSTKHAISLLEAASRQPSPSLTP